MVGTSEVEQKENAIVVSFNVSPLEYYQARGTYLPKTTGGDSLEPGYLPIETNPIEVMKKDITNALGKEYPLRKIKESSGKLVILPMKKQHIREILQKLSESPYNQLLSVKPVEYIEPEKVEPPVKPIKQVEPSTSTTSDIDSGQWHKLLYFGANLGS